MHRLTNDRVASRLSNFYEEDTDDSSDYSDYYRNGSQTRFLPPIGRQDTLLTQSVTSRVMPPRKHRKPNLQQEDFEELAEEFLAYCLEVKQRMARRGIAMSLEYVIKAFCPPLRNVKLPPVSERKPATVLWASMGSNSNNHVKNMADVRMAAAKLLEKKSSQMNSPFIQYKMHNSDNWGHYMSLAKRKDIARLKMEEIVAAAVLAARQADQQNDDKMPAPLRSNLRINYYM